VRAQDAAVLLFADIFPGGGSPIADLFSIALAILMFALLYWLISLIDRI
jgi:hypothetical protein